MRKILSLGLMALILSLITTALSAGYEVCDDPDLKPDLQEAGIYGWCNAWHEAEEGDKDRIAERIIDRAGDSGVDLDWLVTNDPVCPCWTQSEIEAAGVGASHSCGTVSITQILLDFDRLVWFYADNSTREYLSGFDGQESFCQVKAGQVFEQDINLEWDEDEVACRTMLRSAAPEDCVWSN